MKKVNLETNIVIYLGPNIVIFLKSIPKKYFKKNSQKVFSTSWTILNSWTPTEIIVLRINSVASPNVISRNTDDTTYNLREKKGVPKITGQWYWKICSLQNIQDQMMRKPGL